MAAATPPTLVPSTEVRPSSIAGKGLFALEDIPPRRLIGEYTGRSYRNKESALRKGVDPRYLMFMGNRGRVIDGSSPSNKMRYINHPPPGVSANSIARYTGDVRHRRLRIYALRKIRAGEEILYDYGYDPAEVYHPNGVIELSALNFT